MKAIRLEPIRQEDMLRLGLFGWHATAYGDLIAFVRTGPSGRVVAIPIIERDTKVEGLENKAGLLLRFADAVVALSRAELIRFLLQQAACDALTRLNPLADCSHMKWVLDSDDGLIPLAPPAEIVSIRQKWEAYLDPLEPSQLPKSLLASQAADLQNPKWIQSLLKGEDIEVVSVCEFSTARIQCLSAEPVLTKLAELERKAAGFLEKHSEATRELIEEIHTPANPPWDSISARGVLAICFIEGGFRVAYAVAEKLPARDPLEAWGKTEEKTEEMEERAAQTPGRARSKRMPVPWA
jgi:hypothetical protein